MHLFDVSLNGTFGRRLLILVAMLSLATSLSLHAEARERRAPLWIERIEASHTQGRDLAAPLTLTLRVYVVSRTGPVAGARVRLTIVGPAGERIPARALTNADGVGQIVARVPGGGPYDVTGIDIQHRRYTYDPALDTHQFPGYLIPPTGPIYTSDNDDNDDFRRIRQFTSQGVLVREWFPVKATSAPAPTGYVVQSLTTDSQAYVYAELSSFSNASSVCEVQKYTAYGVLVDVIGGECGVAAGQLSSISALATDSHDNLYVVDGFASGTTIEIFDSNGAYITTWLIPFSVNISGLAIDAADNLYLADFAGDTIYKHEQDGDIQSWTADEPRAIGVDSSNLIYATDDTFPYPIAKDVDVFTSTGQPVQTWDAGAGGEIPLELAIDGGDFVYLSSGGLVPGSPMIAKYTSTGAFVLSWNALAGTDPSLTPILYRIAAYH